MDHHIGLLQDFQSLDRQQLRVSGARADQPDRAGSLAVGAFAAAQDHEAARAP